MNNENFKKNLKEKKIELINSLNFLAKNINIKLKNKENINIQEYKNEKNKEINSLKTELNTILTDIDKIINNIIS